MRRTKAWLERALEGAITFQMMPVVYLKPSAELRIRKLPDFMPACHYGYGQMPGRDEIGRTTTHRYVLMPTRRK